MCAKRYDKKLTEEQSGKVIVPGTSKTNLAVTGEEITETAEKLQAAKAKEGVPMGVSDTYVYSTIDKAIQQQLTANQAAIDTRITQIQRLRKNLINVPREFQTAVPIQNITIVDPKTNAQKVVNNPFYTDQTNLARYGVELAKLYQVRNELEAQLLLKSGQSAAEIFSKPTTVAKRDAKQSAEWQHEWQLRYGHKNPDTQMDADMFKPMQFVMGRRPCMDKVASDEIIELTKGTAVHTPYGIYTIDRPVKTTGFGITLAKDLDPKHSDVDTRVQRYIVTESTGAKSAVIKYIVEETL